MSTTRRSINDIPEAATGDGFAPTRIPVLAETLGNTWLADYQASDQYSRARSNPELPLRASDVSKRCDRQFVYAISDTPKSNPPGAASTFRMMLGQMVHSAVDQAVKGIVAHTLDSQGRQHGWYAEVDVDLRPAGIEGSAHADLVYYEHGEAQIVAEVKSMSGFPYKKATTKAGGPPEGPRWDHVMQAAMVAVALNAPRILIIYVSMEPTSPQEADRMGLNEIGRFMAEWEIATSTWSDAVYREARRQQRLLNIMREAPDHLVERRLVSPEVPAGAVVANPARGTWEVLDVDNRVIKSGTKWFCGYCDWRDRCIQDGDNTSIVPDQPKF